MRFARLSPALLLASVAALALNCGGDDDVRPDTGRAVDAGTEASSPLDSAIVDAADGGTTATNPKLDLLFVVDNSSFMFEKHASLAGSLEALFRNLRATDVHVGMVSTSFRLRNMCPGGVHDEKAHLIHRISRDPNDGIVPGSESGFLSFGPGGSTPDVESLTQRTGLLIHGAADRGCGVEAQLEALYRFAVEPDPSISVTIDPSTNLPSATGVDYELLAQRKAFFRPDSTVAFVILTDEDDASIDFFSGGGFGHSYLATDFPGSKVPSNQVPAGFTAARGTSACASSPASPECTSCAFGLSCDAANPECTRIQTDSACLLSPGAGQNGPGFSGFFGPLEDNYNLRAYDMKRRFGIEARFPVTRYIAALSGRRLPNRTTAHPESNTGGVRVIGPYSQAETCSNPLMSIGLPEAAGDELCALPAGPRTAKQILFGFLGGTLPGSPGKEPRWDQLLGRDPDALDLTGIDPHMRVSAEPRPGLGGAELPIGDNGTDPIHGREWQTKGTELQYACTYPLDEPYDCSGDFGFCECPPNRTDGQNPPVCGGKDNGVIIRGKAFPGRRELQVAKALGDRSIIASVCGGSAEYRSFQEALAARINAVAAP